MNPSYIFGPSLQMYNKDCTCNFRADLQIFAVQSGFFYPYLEGVKIHLRSYELWNQGLMNFERFFNIRKNWPLPLKRPHHSYVADSSVKVTFTT